MRSDIWPLLRPLVRTVSLFLAVALGGLIGPLPRLGVIPPRSRQHHLDCVQGIGACCRPMKFLATSALLLTPDIARHSPRLSTISRTRRARFGSVAASPHCRYWANELCPLAVRIIQ
jgi:hypothetical protein